MEYAVCATHTPLMRHTVRKTREFGLNRINPKRFEISSSCLLQVSPTSPPLRPPCAHLLPLVFHGQERIHGCARYRRFWNASRFIGLQAGWVSVIPSFPPKLTVAEVSRRFEQEEAGNGGWSKEIEWRGTRSSLSLSLCLFPWSCDFLIGWIRIIIGGIEIEKEGGLSLNNNRIDYWSVNNNEC